MVDATLRIVFTILALLVALGVIAMIIRYYKKNHDNKPKKSPLTSAQISNLVNTQLRLPSQPVGEAVAAKLNSINDADLTKAVMDGDSDALLAVLLKINGVVKMPSGAKIGFLVYGCPTPQGTTFYSYDGQKSPSAPPCPSQ